VKSLGIPAGTKLAFAQRMRTCLVLLCVGCVAPNEIQELQMTEQPDLAEPAGLPDLATPKAIDLASPSATTDLAQAITDASSTPQPVNGSGMLNGSVGVHSVPTVKSVFAVVNTTSFSIYLSDRDDLCKVLQDQSSPKETRFLRFGSTSGMPKTFASGSYTYPSGGGGGGGGGGGSGGGGGAGDGMGTRHALIATTSANCAVAGYTQASAGSFTIDAAVDTTTSSVGGTFDITFTAGTITGTTKGSFTAPVCKGATEIPLTPVYCE
jgi:hypothetical protein